MSLRGIGQTVFLAAGIAILVLLVVPAVHVPFLIVHGPLTALRAQRAASLIDQLLLAAAYAIAALLPVAASIPVLEHVCDAIASATPLDLTCSLRC